MTVNSETVDVPTKMGADGVGEGAGIISMSLKAQAWYLIMPFLPTTLWHAVMANTHVVLKIESGLGDVWQGTLQCQAQTLQANTTKRKLSALR